MPATPETRYAKVDEWYVGYQVVGSGQRDILFSTSWPSNLDVLWEDPARARYLERLANFGRLICYDPRGAGISDGVELSDTSTLEGWMDDAMAVLDAVESRHAVVIGDAEGGPMAMLLAASHPERVSSLVLVNSFARLQRDVDYRIGYPASMEEKLLDAYERAWGSGSLTRLTAPGVADDEAFVQRLGRYERLAMAPRASALSYRWMFGVDVRAVLPNIQAPTLVLHRRENRHYRLAYGRYLAEHIAGAKLVELDGADVYPFYAGEVDGLLDEIGRFVTGAADVAREERVLATVLFTDIVDSTARAIALGDEAWLNLRQSHDDLVRREIERHRGTEIETTGDGFLINFDGPARAIRCATAIAEEVRQLGLEVRAGLHTGEVELRSGSIAGVAVHIAARVLALAGAGEVFVSGTVRDLVVGSGIEFAERGQHRLKGVPGAWSIFSVARVP